MEQGQLEWGGGGNFILLIKKLKLTSNYYSKPIKSLISRFNSCSKMQLSSIYNICSIKWIVYHLEMTKLKYNITITSILNMYYGYESD